MSQEAGDLGKGGKMEGKREWLLEEESEAAASS